MARATTAAFVRRALALLRSQEPAAFHRMLDELRPAGVRLEVGGERFAVEARGDRAVVGRRPTRPPAGAVGAGPGVVVDLADGRLDLLGAVEAGRLDVRGDLDGVLRLARAFAAFADGAVRAPGMPALLEEYRAARPDRDQSGRVTM